MMTFLRSLLFWLLDLDGYIVTLSMWSQNEAMMAMSGFVV